MSLPQRGAALWVGDGHVQFHLCGPEDPMTAMSLAPPSVNEDGRGCPAMSERSPVCPDSWKLD